MVSRCELSFHFKRGPCQALRNIFACTTQEFNQKCIMTRGRYGLASEIGIAKKGGLMHEESIKRGHYDTTALYMKGEGRNEIAISKKGALLHYESIRRGYGLVWFCVV